MFGCKLEGHQAREKSRGIKLTDDGFEIRKARASDTVSRQGGDEFVVLLSEVELSEDAAITARRMLHAVSRPHSIDQHDLHVTTSIGVSVYPEDELDAETLTKNADTKAFSFSSRR